MSVDKTKIKELLAKKVVLEKEYWKARDAYYAAEKEYDEEWWKNIEADKSPELRELEAKAASQTQKCCCICNCNATVRGMAYQGTIYFGRCGDCVETGCG